MLQSFGYSAEQIAFMSLQAAAKNLDVDQVSSLLNAGASLSMPDAPTGSPSLKDNTSPMFIACRQKEPKAADVVQLFLKAGADANAQSSSGGQTALHIAAGGADPEVINTLLAAGADPSLRTQVLLDTAKTTRGMKRAHPHPNLKCRGINAGTHIRAQTITDTDGHRLPKPLSVALAHARPPPAPIQALVHHHAQTAAAAGSRLPAAAVAR
jgi:hypothetical protein